MSSLIIEAPLGWRIVHRQGDPVPSYPQNEFQMTVYASTLFVPIGGSLILPEPMPPSEDEPLP